MISIHNINGGKRYAQTIHGNPDGIHVLLPDGSLIYEPDAVQCKMIYSKA